MVKNGKLHIPTRFFVISTTGVVAIAVTAATIFAITLPKTDESRSNFVPTFEPELMETEEKTEVVTEEVKETPAPVATKRMAAVAKTEPAPAETTTTTPPEVDCARIHSQLYRWYIDPNIYKQPRYTDGYREVLKEKYRSGMVKSGCDPTEFIDLDTIYKD